MKFINFVVTYYHVEESPAVNSMNNVRGRMGSMRLPMSWLGVHTP